MKPKTLLIIALTISAVSIISHAQSSARAFNEPHVMRSLRLLHAAQSTFQATAGNGNYGNLENLRQSGFIDEALASGEKYGYVYGMTVTAGTPSSFQVTATPRRYRKTGIRSFFIDSTGDLRGADKQGQPATSTDPVIDDCTSGAIIENERCTIGDMGLLTTAQFTFAATIGGGNFGQFPNLHQAGLIRSDLSDYSARGYLYQVQTIDHQSTELPASFKIWATPSIYGVTGVRSFYVDQTGIIRGADKNGGQANQDDPPVN